MRFSLLLLYFFLIMPFAKAQQTQIFTPLQKPAARSFGLPVMPAFPLLPVKDSAKVMAPQNTLPVNFYSTHLGVACKVELNLEKGIKLPLRIRLGSKDQVDYLEGKYNRNN